MAGVRVLVGTRKGAFILTSDEARTDWKVEGPHFPGWEIYHVNGSPADPDRIYVSQTSEWFGQIIQRSSDGGQTWEVPGGEQIPDPYGPPAGVSNKFAYDDSSPVGTHLFYDNSAVPWQFKRVWHLEPSVSDPDTVYAGVEDAALFKTTNGGQSWEELTGLRAHESAANWMPGAGGLGLHTIVLDESNEDRMFVAISAAGVFRTEDGGKSWLPKNKGLNSEFMPDPEAEVGHCVHRIAMHPSRPNTLFMQKHWDVMRTDDGGDSWREISGDLPTDFGFVVDVHSKDPDTVFVVPIKSDSEHFPPDGKFRVFRSKSGGDDWEAMTKGLPQENCYVNIFRDAMAVDSLDDCGVYFGTSGGQVYASADGGDSWNAIVHDLPPIYSVEVQTLP